MQQLTSVICSRIRSETTLIAADPRGSPDLLVLAGHDWRKGVPFFRSVSRLDHLLRPIAGDRPACVLYGIPQQARGATHDGIAVFIEHDNFVVPGDAFLPALMIQQDYVVCLLLLVIDDHRRAALAEGLDDFRGLRAGSALACSSEAVGAPADTGGYFPRLTVSHKTRGLSADHRTSAEP